MNETILDCNHEILSPEGPWDRIYCCQCRQEFYDWQIGRPLIWILRYRWTWIYYTICIGSLEKLLDWLDGIELGIEHRRRKNEDYLSTMIDKWDIY